ncbi:MAG: PD-(D/E)XK nuclease family protein [Candidatus Levybacteria bacterium]|nr:PD-(D/E)XK nuclease family protein [Candidatus Levybacteria bacterium]
MTQMYKLSPSDFAYLWEECKFCYYQKVKLGVSHSGIFPAMFGRINKLLQDSVIGKNLQEISTEIPSGIIDRQEGFIKSIQIPGTNCYLNGRYDLLIKLDDGTFAIIDFKITTPDEEQILKKYATQLHAYKFALENPMDGNPVKISELGIVSVHPNEMKLIDGKIVFTSTPAWHPITEDMDSFMGMIREIDLVLNGRLPKPSEACRLCIYRSHFKNKT